MQSSGSITIYIKTSVNSPSILFVQYSEIPPGFCKMLVEMGFTRYHKMMIMMMMIIIIIIMIMMMMMMMMIIIIIIIINTGTPIHFFSFHHQ